MTGILTTVLDICLLRRGPQHLPRGWTMALLCMVANVAVYAFFRAQVEADGSDLAPALLSIGLLVIFSAAVLRFFGLFDRLPQTVAALSATSALLSLATLPVVMVLIADVDAARPATEWATVVWLSAFVWSFAVDAHIFRSALSTTFTVGVLVSVVWFAINVYVRYFLLGQPI